MYAFHGIKFIFYTCCRLQFTHQNIFHPPSLRTQPPTVIHGYRADAHGLTLKSWWVVQPVTTHSPTNLYPPSHDSRFLRTPASLNSESDPKANAATQENKKNSQRSNAVMSLSTLNRPSRSHYWYQARGSQRDTDTNTMPGITFYNCRRSTSSLMLDRPGGSGGRQGNR